VQLGEADAACDEQSPPDDGCDVLQADAQL